MQYEKQHWYPIDCFDNLLDESKQRSQCRQRAWSAILRLEGVDRGVYCKSTPLWICVRLRTPPHACHTRPLSVSIYVLLFFQLLPSAIYQSDSLALLLLFACCCWTTPGTQQRHSQCVVLHLQEYTYTSRSSVIPTTHTRVDPYVHPMGTRGVSSDHREAIRTVRWPSLVNEFSIAIPVCHLRNSRKSSKHDSYRIHDIHCIIAISIFTTCTEKKDFIYKYIGTLDFFKSN